MIVQGPCITNCAAIEGWCHHIRLAYPESILLTSEKHLPFLRVDDQTHAYIVLNYEKFQQRKRDFLIRRLLQLPLDFIVFDEIQFIKQRQTHASKRREVELTRFWGYPNMEVGVVETHQN